MNSGINSKKLFYVVSSFLLLIAILFSIKINYAVSQGRLPDEGVATSGEKNLTIGRTALGMSEPVPAPSKTAKVAVLETAGASPANARVEKAEAPADAAKVEKSDAIDKVITTEKIKKMNGKYRIVIDKSRFELTLYKGDAVAKVYKIAYGRNPDGADKKAKGDFRTPEGHFWIMSYQPSDTWLHEGKYAYGPWFMRLKTPWNGIGIHGTDEPDSIGKRASDGCVRMHSEDVAELKGLLQKQIDKKDKVFVDIVANAAALEKAETK